MLADLADAYRRGVETEIARLSDRIVNARCETFEEYRAACGEIDGLRKAVRLFSETLSKQVSIEEMQDV